MVWDLGCNVGEYAEVALDAGAGYVVGWDMDQGALDTGFVRARERGLGFLPLHFDAANPSPSQGWAQSERDGMMERGSADMVLALAFVHHLAIARNVPLDHIARWLTGLGRTGVIEFVQKSDPTVQQMLALREDIFPDYSLDCFTAAISKYARITKSRTISQTGSESGRHLLVFDRG
jgi:ribosomal protein L11 methylase PrmA